MSIQPNFLKNHSTTNPQPASMQLKSYLKPLACATLAALGVVLAAYAAHRAGLFTSQGTPVPPPPGGSDKTGDLCFDHERPVTAPFQNATLAVSPNPYFTPRPKLACIPTFTYPKINSDKPFTEILPSLAKPVFHSYRSAHTKV